VRLQATIAAALRKTRLDNGALDIETVEDAGLVGML